MRWSEVRTKSNGATHAMADYQSIIYEKVEDKIFRVTLIVPKRSTRCRLSSCRSWTRRLKRLTTILKRAC